jgi:pimeloyl-ACP methyl ester carboxylesterase
MMRWLRRIALSFVALLIVVVGVGTAFETYARRQAGIDFPPAGKMVSIGERRLQLDCRGNGSPTVVFEHGLDTAGSLSWSKVHSQVAGFTRACAYSRAGVLWSDPDEGVRDGEAVAEDLHKLLNAAGEKPPFVMVAHSLGGPYAMIYTKHFGAEVAGLVLVDASHPNQIRPNASLDMSVSRHFMWSGLGRLFPEAAKRSTPGDDSARDNAIAAYWPLSFAAEVQELEGIDRTLTEAAAFHELGARPLSVLTAMRDYSEEAMAAAHLTAEQKEEAQRWGRMWKEWQDEEAGWSSVSEHQLVPDSGHYIQQDKPDVVIAAAKWVVDRVRGPEKAE